ncbi:MAG: GGDEF domain-containing protein [Candidatus Eremiobacteraeota bacterium]|nr:GGDEF domain-containing protein [Candidatus Eremiobacteraeota bacterium]
MTSEPLKTVDVGGRAPLPKEERLPCIQLVTGPSAGRLFIANEELSVGRNPASAIHFNDAGVSWKHARIYPDQGLVWLQDLGSTNGTYLGEETVDNVPLRQGELIYFGPASAARFGHLSRSEIELATRLYESATRDHLTGALNRASFQERLQHEIQYGQRHGVGFVLALLDVDFFKNINDNFGHPAGDAVLRQLVELANTHTRLEDVVARWGGEEFIILLRNIALDGGLEMAERLREKVEAATFTVPCAEETRDLKVTISLGVAPWSQDLTQDQLIALADQALYRAKQAGRNRVES